MARVSRVRVFINGDEMTDLKNYKRKARTSGVVVKLMDRHDVADTTPEHGFTIDYVPQAGVSEFDFAKAFDGTGTTRVAKKGGGTTIFMNCKLLSIGEENVDGEKELVKTIDVFAEDSTDE